MPPVNQQGSRAGLITTLIITIVLLFVSVIMWIYNNTQAQKNQVELDLLRRRYKEVVTDSQLLPDSDVAHLVALKTKLSLPNNASAIDVGAAEVQVLTKQITGKSGDYEEALQAARQVIDGAKAEQTDPKDNKPTPVLDGSSDSLVDAVKKLSAALKAQKDLAAKANESAKAAADQLAKATASSETQIATLDAAVKAADAKAAEAEKKLQSEMASANTRVGSAGEDAKKWQEDATKQIADANAKAQQADAEKAKVAKENDSLRVVLSKYRFDTKNPIVRRSSGQVVSVPASNTVYISLGAADHVTPGMTFEVYDKAEGIPGLGKDPLGDDGLPVGKASIEIIRIGQNSSECRIVHQQPATTIVQGDPIMNLVYDRHTKFHFYVYGEFDADLNGVWSTGEADVVKSMITRWGGVVDDKVTVDTDFVILGREPQIPNFSKEDLVDAVNLAKVNAAKAALDEYITKINDAAHFYIPIMNQNRFFYYTGHFDLAKR